MQTYIKEQVACELHIASTGGQGARAMACLLADVGQLQGMTALSMRSSTQPQMVRCPEDTEEACVKFAGPGNGKTVRVTAVMSPSLMNSDGEGLLLVNSSKPVESETVRSLDADGIASKLGIPSYLPMVGAMARAAGWTNLDRVKAAVRLALDDIAPYWSEAGVRAVEAGYRSLDH